ncbi:MAG: hypothetical protein WD749_07125 [Phycisphaerales bacterium]
MPRQKHPAPWTTRRLAALLGVSASRVSQIARERRIKPLRRVNRECVWPANAPTLFARRPHGNSKLTPRQVGAIRASRESTWRAARRYGVSAMTISLIRRGKRRTKG